MGGNVNYEEALKDCPDAAAIRRALAEHKELPQGEYCVLPAPARQQSPELEALSRLALLFASIVASPEDVYIVVARLCGLSDATISERLGRTAASIGYRRQLIASMDEAFAPIVNHYMPEHPAVNIKGVSTIGQKPCRINPARKAGDRRIRGVKLGF